MLVTVGIFYMRSPGEPSQYIYIYIWINMCQSHGWSGFCTSLYQRPPSRRSKRFDPIPLKVQGDLKYGLTTRTFKVTSLESLSDLFRD